LTSAVLETSHAGATGAQHPQPAAHTRTAGDELRLIASEPDSTPGTELPCPNCGKQIKLNPFTIDADWRPVAAAWRGGESSGG